jgi:hypothetical protein
MSRRCSPKRNTTFEVSPVAQPGYLTTSTAVRSLARQVGEDPQDVEALAAKGELRSLLTRTDLQVSAPPTVEPGVPTPLDVAQRTYQPSDEMMRMQSATMRRKVEMDAQAAPSIDLLRRRLKSMKMKMDWEDRGEFVEARSLPGGDVDRFGNPARRDRWGNAVD